MASTQIRFTTQTEYAEAAERGFQLTMMIPTAGGLYTTIQQAPEGPPVSDNGVVTQTYRIVDQNQGRVAELVIRDSLASLKPWRPLTAAERSLGVDSFEVSHLGLPWRVVASEAGTWAVRLVYPASFSENDVDTGVALTGARAVVEGVIGPIVEAGIRNTIKAQTESVSESVLEAASLTLMLATKGQYAQRVPGQAVVLPGEGQLLYEQAVVLVGDLTEFTEGLLELAGPPA